MLFLSRMQLFAYRSICRTRSSRYHLEEELACHQRVLAPRRFSLPSSSVHSRSEVVETSLLQSSSSQVGLCLTVCLSYSRQSRVWEVHWWTTHWQQASLTCLSEQPFVSVHATLTRCKRGHCLWQLRTRQSRRTGYQAVVTWHRMGLVGTLRHLDTLL